MTLISYCTTDITTYIDKMKEEPMTMTIPESYFVIPATNEAGDMTGFAAHRWFDREEVHHETFQTPVAPGDQYRLTWEVTGLGWRILHRTGMDLTLAAPADARYEFPEDADF